MIPVQIQEINNLVFDKIGMIISEIQQDKESSDYDAFQFKLNNLNVLYRKAKITPTKLGLFVTVWKRNKIKNVIEPFDFSDEYDLIVVNCKTENNHGFFVFSAAELLSQHVFSTEKKEGKRAIRVYPTWENNLNKQASKTLQWQSKYFVNLPIIYNNFEIVKHLFSR